MTEPSAPTLKLYIWDGALKDWTAGIMFAFAENVDHARELLLAECNYVPTGELMIAPEVFETPVARVIWGGA